MAGFAGYIHNCSASVAYYHPGQPLQSDDVPFPRPNQWWEEAAALVTMHLVFGWGSHMNLPLITGRGYAHTHSIG